jgi:hypothetical protein
LYRGKQLANKDFKGMSSGNEITWQGAWHSIRAKGEGPFARIGHSATALDGEYFAQSRTKFVFEGDGEQTYLEQVASMFYAQA